MSDYNQILTGKYLYTKNQQAYCEENFSVQTCSDPRLKFLINAEILSRSQTGEFLKVNVDYLLDSSFTPKRVEIKRSMGEKLSREVFSFDNAQYQLNYSFSDNKDTWQHTAKSSSQPQVASPSFATSMLATMAKRVDQTQRTKYKIITSPNIWKYAAPFVEEEFSLTPVDSKPVKIELGKNQVSATHCSISQPNTEDTDPKGPQVFISKHFSIPYKGIFAGGIVIEAESLKIMDNKVAHIF